MKKTLLTLLTIALAFTAMQPSQAQDQKVLAIIDSAIDSSAFPSVIHEACFTTVKTQACPNGQFFMEGKGSANAVFWAKSINDSIYHGQSMVKAALAVNPNVKIVFVRYSNVLSTGASMNTPQALLSAIDWVSKNAEKYSIDALSISQSSVDAKNLSLCSTDKATISAISSLNSKNIPVFAATGNDGRKDIVGFPSCFSGVIGVGALSSLTDSSVETATNRGPGLDLVAIGSISITKVNGSPFVLSGSSGATAISASAYLKNGNGKLFQEYMSGLPLLKLSVLDRATKKTDPTFAPTVPYSPN